MIRTALHLRLAWIVASPGICILPKLAAAQTVTVNASWRVMPLCTVAAASAFPIADLGEAGNRSATATVTCNKSFKISASSANGAIRTSGAAPAGFANALPYTLRIDVPLDDGSRISASCTSPTLVAGQSACPLSPANGTGLTSAGRIATSQAATLTVSWSAVALPTRLIAGSYADTITLSIATVP